MKFVFNPISGTLDYVASSAADVGISFPLAPNLGGTGVANAVGSTLTLGAATSITGGGTVSLGGYTLTVPATGTAALLATANVFTTIQKINVNSSLALLVEQDGVKDNVFVVDTVNGRVGIGTGLPEDTLHVSGGRIIIDNNRVIGGKDTNGTVRSLFYIDTNNFSRYGSSGLVDSYFDCGGLSGAIILKGTTGRISIGAGASPSTRLHVQDTTTTTNAVKEILRLQSAVSTASTGGANGFGVGQSFYAETATDATYQQQGLISTSWIDATNATRKAKMSLSAYDTAERLGMEIEASGSAAKLAFYGGTTVVRGAALTTQLTTITHTAPGTPDYAIQDFVDVSLGAGWAFKDHDEANSLLAVIVNLQTRVAELEARLGSATGVNLFA